MALQMENALAAEITELGRFDPVERALTRTKAVQRVEAVASRAWIAARSSQLRRLMSIGSTMTASKFSLEATSYRSFAGLVW
jgi:hypothetical protein